MHVETSSITERPDLALPAQIDRSFDPLRRIVREARARAVRSGQPILATLTLPVERIDPILVYAAFDAVERGTRFYWGRPAAQTAIAGIGAATMIEDTGDTPILSASDAWHDLIQHAVIGTAGDTMPGAESGPVCFGGFTFDPLAPRSALWDGFPNGLLILPRLSVRSHPNCAMLTLNRMIAAEEESEQCVEDMLGDLVRLYATLQEQSPRSPAIAANSDEQLTSQDICPASEWKDIVAGAVRDIRHGDYKKVVLARSVLAARNEGAFDICATLRRLRESYPEAYVFALQRGGSVFICATPEPLVCAQDGQLHTVALAGTMPRGETEEDDARLGKELLSSAKNREEHAIVVETMRDALGGLCAELEIAPEPRLLKLKNVHHLETPITGQLLPELSILDAVACLHPTPAVGGFPRQPALEKIRRDERLDRGWYAGPVGWIDAGGNGEFAVALRSALIQGNKATLFAGNGIVADSEPESEYTETCLKAQVMLRGLAGGEGKQS